MKKEFKILIADRNPHVREFLKREITASGYQVQLAESGREVLKWVYSDESVDLLILDPDLPDTDPISLLNKLQNRLPYIPVVLHIFSSDAVGLSEILNIMGVVEKGGSSVEQLKTLASDILKKSGPDSSQIVLKKYKTEIAD